MKGQGFREGPFHFVACLACRDTAWYIGRIGRPVMIGPLIDDKIFLHHFPLTVRDYKRRQGRFATGPYKQKDRIAKGAAGMTPAAPLLNRPLAPLLGGAVEVVLIDQD